MEKFKYIEVFFFKDLDIINFVKWSVDIQKVYEFFQR